MPIYLQTHPSTPLRPTKQTIQPLPLLQPQRHELAGPHLAILLGGPPDQDVLLAVWQQRQLGLDGLDPRTLRKQFWMGPSQPSHVRVPTSLFLVGTGFLGSGVQSHPVLPMPPLSSNFKHHMETPWFP